MRPIAGTYPEPGNWSPVDGSAVATAAAAAGFAADAFGLRARVTLAGACTTGAGWLVAGADSLVAGVASGAGAAFGEALTRLAVARRGRLGGIWSSDAGVVATTERYQHPPSTGLSACHGM